MEDSKKIYLDTSVISALFDSRTPERQVQTQELWKSLKDYDVYISEIVLEEINDAPSPLKENFLAVVAGFNVLSLTDKAKKLANDYVLNDIFPNKYLDDAYHVAIASVNKISYLLSWNFKHLVKVKTRRLVTLVNAVEEYLPVEILTPPEL